MKKKHLTFVFKRNYLGLPKELSTDFDFIYQIVCNVFSLIKLIFENRRRLLNPFFSFH